MRRSSRISNRSTPPISFCLPALLQLHRGDLVESFHQRAQRFEVLVAAERAVAHQVFVDHADGAAHVAHLVGNRAHQDARAGQQLLEAGFLALAQFLGGVHHQRGQARSHGRLVGGEEDVRQEHLAVLVLAAALHLGAEGLRRLSQERHAAQSRHVAADAAPGQLALRDPQQAMGRLVGPQHLAIGGHDQNGHRAGVDEKLQLLFGRAAGGHLALHAVQVLQLAPAAARHFESEQAGARQRREHQNVLRQRNRDGERKGIEEIGERGAEQRQCDDVPSRPYRSHQQDGEQVQERESDGRVDAPVDQSDHPDQDRRQRDPRGFMQMAKNQHRAAPPTLNSRYNGTSDQDRYPKDRLRYTER